MCSISDESTLTKEIGVACGDETESDLTWWR